MAETLSIDISASKEDKYESLLPQVESLISGEKYTVPVLANVAAALKQTFDFFWVGFYTVEENQLVLGPFQGPIACSSIGFGKGVCGKAWEKSETMVVGDVNEFPGHIACSSESRSEIVVPVSNSQGKVTMVLDVDSKDVSGFDHVDKKYLEELVLILSKVLYKA